MEHENVRFGVESLHLSFLSFLLSEGHSPLGELIDVFRFPNMRPSPRCLETELLVLHMFSTSVATEHRLRFSRWIAYLVNFPWIEIFTNSFSSHTSWISKEYSLNYSMYSIKSSLCFYHILQISVVVTLSCVEKKFSWSILHMVPHESIDPGGRLT